MPTAVVAADELSEHDALSAHVNVELGLERGQLANPWAAAASSAASFTAGALLPLVAILLPPASIRVPVAFAAVVVGLLLTGWVSATLGEAPKRRAITRLIIGGAIAMAVTFAIGYVLGTVTS
jgi:VIT1/CCC1 family predicted Fe2+/Mn2+ transporter